MTADEDVVLVDEVAPVDEDDEGTAGPTVPALLARMWPDAAAHDTDDRAHQLGQAVERAQALVPRDQPRRARILGRVVDGLLRPP